MKSLPENATIGEFRQAFQTLLDRHTPTNKKIDVSSLSDEGVLKLYDIICTKDNTIREQKWNDGKEEVKKAEQQLISDSYEVLSIKEQLDNIWSIRDSIKEFSSELKTPSLKDLESEINLSFDK